MANINIIENQDITGIDSGLIGHGCNCVGGFGSGVARAIKTKWPQVAVEFYNQGTGSHLLGTAYAVPVNESLVVCNLYTQLNCGNDGQRYANPEAINKSLRKLMDYAVRNEIKDVYIPPIGAGLGGLDWEADVQPVINNVAQDFDDEITINVCFYNG